MVTIWALICIISLSEPYSLKCILCHYIDSDNFSRNINKKRLLNCWAWASHIKNYDLGKYTLLDTSFEGPLHYFPGCRNSAQYCVPNYGKRNHSDKVTCLVIEQDVWFYLSNLTCSGISGCLKQLMKHYLLVGWVFTAWNFALNEELIMWIVQ